jgi:hypothetical protein
VGCFNDKQQKNPTEEQIRAGDRFVDAIAVCDDCGVVIIEKDYHNEYFLEKLELMEQQEDVWYDCVNRKKWSTFDTICLKKYLDKTS